MSQNTVSLGKYQIADRALDFAAEIARLTANLPFKRALKEYSTQIIRSSASIGANLEEADGAISHRDFVNKFVIARKEARETHYWLRLIVRTGFVTEFERQFTDLIQEARELILIISSIIVKVRTKMPNTGTMPNTKCQKIIGTMIKMIFMMDYDFLTEPIIVII